MNRSSIPTLLRARGGRTKKESAGDMVSDVKRKSGSLTHGSLTKEPSFRALKAPKKDIEYGLPHASPRRSPKGESGSAENARMMRSRKSPEKFNDPKEFGPNMCKSSSKGDHFKKGGAAEGGHWIQSAIKKPGALHKTLGVKPGHKIPEAKLEKAEHSRNPTTRRRARLAETLKGFHH